MGLNRREKIPQAKLKIYKRMYRRCMLIFETTEKRGKYCNNCDQRHGKPNGIKWNKEWNRL